MLHASSMSSLAFNASPATAADEVGFGRCRADVDVWLAAGVKWWGQAVCLRIDRPRDEDVLAEADVGTAGRSPSKEIGSGHERPQHNSVSLAASGGPSISAAENNLSENGSSIDAWCTAWPRGSSMTATVDVSVIASTANADHPLLKTSTGPALTFSRSLRCTVIRVAARDPLPLTSITVVLAANPRGVEHVDASDSARVRRALRGKPIALGCTVCVDWFGHGSPEPRASTTGHTESSASRRLCLTFHDCVPTLEEDSLGCVTDTTVVTVMEGTSGSGSSVGTSHTLHGLPRRELPPGLEDACRELESLVRLPLLYAAVFAELGVECPKGVLLHGPPGTGKTLLARTVAEEAGAAFISIDGPELFAPYLGESEENLRRVFGDAQLRATTEPVVLFIDEIDAMCPRRDPGKSHESRVVAQLLTLMDGMQSRGRLVVLAATNRPNALDPALRRPGRFDREVEIRTPTQLEREGILRYCARGVRVADDLMFDRLAERTNGYVGADLAALSREAVLAAIRRADAEIMTLNMSGGSSASVPEALDSTAPKQGKHDSVAPPVIAVTKHDYDVALRKFVPSTRRGNQMSVAPTRWEDIGGLVDVKAQLEQAVLWPLLYPQTFSRLRITPPRGILLHGPPGTGKTTLARALATQGHASFFSLSGAEVFSPYVGDAERAIRDVFRKARLASPSVIFFDEIDAVVGNRSERSDSGGVQQRLLATLLTELDGVAAAGRVLLVGATNRPDALDSAFVRAGRIDRMILVPLPDRDARLSILQVKTSVMPLASDVDLGRLADATEGSSGADLENICREAALLALREDIGTLIVNGRHFATAASKLKCS